MPCHATEMVAFRQGRSLSGLKPKGRRAITDPASGGRVLDGFDYIIVGAGSAGSVLAERLSASGRHRVLVLEAGGTDRRFYVHLPLGYGKLFFDPAVNWMYRTEPDPGLAGNQDFWPRGKILGGSSSINAMVWIRGHKSDYDDWAERAGPAWGWDAAREAYRAIEDNEAGGNDVRGTGGPLFISANRKDLHPLVDTYIRSAEATGLPHNEDFNGAEQEGVGIYQMTIHKARRNSAARAFLRPAMKRANVTVMTHAHVTRVLFEGNRAVGVEYRRGGQLHQARAGREVILSGGAINSPQLLMLSGIGPAAHLKSHGIGVIADNAQVGRNLNDHQGVNYTWRMTVPTYNDILRPWWGKLLVGMKYVMGGRGPLAKSINHAGGFFRTSPDLPRPNMQLYFQAFSTLIPRVGERPLLTPDPFSGLSIGLSNCRPTSRGEITLNSADPFAAPRIVANAFSTDHDVRRDAAGGETPAKDRGAGADEVADCRGIAAGAGGHERRGPHRRFPRPVGHGLPPLLHGPHGQRCRHLCRRSRPESARRRGTQGLRRFGLSNAHRRQYQCAVDSDRLDRGRPHNEGREVKGTHDLSSRRRYRRHLY